jgi:hypothetical protein
MYSPAFQFRLISFGLNNANLTKIYPLFIIQNEISDRGEVFYIFT